MFSKEWLGRLNLGEAQLNRILSSEEQDELAEWLVADELPETTMTLEEFDGFCCALAVGPFGGTFAQPIWEWLPVVFGQDNPPVFPQVNEEKRFYSLLLRHYQGVQSALSRPKVNLREDEYYSPWVYEVVEDERIQPVQLNAEGEREGNWLGRWWAAGFGVAVLEWESAWTPLFKAAETQEGVFALIEPFQQLERGYDEFEPDAEFDDTAVLTGCVLAAYDLRRWWQVTLTPKVPIRRAAGLGRNDVCRCGSGKKYKKCCGAGRS
jgi:uncharacterized protein